MDTAKLFQNGKSQAVRLPKDYRLPGSQVFIKKLGNAVILIPTTNSWDSLFESLALFSNDFMESREQLAHAERESLFE